MKYFSLYQKILVSVNSVDSYPKAEDISQMFQKMALLEGESSR